MTFSTQCTFTSHGFLIHFISHTLVSEDKQNIDSKLSSDLRHPNLYVFLVFIVCCEKRLNIVLTNYIINATMNYTYHIYLSTVLPLNTQLYVCQSVEHLIGRVGARDFTDFSQVCLWDKMDRNVSFPHYAERSDWLFELVWLTDRNYELLSSHVTRKYVTKKKVIINQYHE